MLRQRTTYHVTRRRRFSPLLLTGLIVPAILVIVVASIFLLPRIGSHAAEAAVNMDCTLIVPPNPLTVQGLATPYQLVATNPDNGPCKEANKMQAAFVQGDLVKSCEGRGTSYVQQVRLIGSSPGNETIVIAERQARTIDTRLIQRNFPTDGLSFIIQISHVEMVCLIGSSPGDCQGLIPIDVSQYGTSYDALE